MQGVFNVNWDEVLDPGIDEQTSNILTKGADKAPVRPRRERRRRGGDGEDGARGGDGDDEARGGEDKGEPAKGSKGEREPASGDDTGKKRGSGSDTESVHSEDDDDQPPPPRRRRRPPEEVLDPKPADLSFTMRHVEQTVTVFVMPGRFELQKGKFGHYIKPFVVNRANTCQPFPLPAIPEGLKNDVILPGFPGYPWPPEKILQDMESAPDRQQYWNQLPEWSNNNLKTRINFPQNLTLANSHPTDDIPYLFSIRSGHVAAAWRPCANLDDATADPNMVPDVDYCREGVHFISANSPLDDPSPYYEIGHDNLKEVLQEAEELDYEFAKRIQGLVGASQDFTWACLDPDFVPSDRALLLSEFTKTFTGDFLSSAKGDANPRSVATEQLQQHRAFSQEWVRKHYKNLTPAVTSPAEALVMEFYPQLTKRMPAQGKLTPAQLSRYFMRHPKFSPAFAHVLQYYMQHLDNGRGGRNPSYKQVTQTGVMRALQFRTFVEHLERERQLMAVLYLFNQNHLQHLSNPYLVDWHYVVGKLPEVHRHYPRSGEVFLGGGKRRWEAGEPPWLYTR